MLKVLSMLSTVIQRPWSLFYILDITFYLFTVLLSLV